MLAGRRSRPGVGAGARRPATTPATSWSSGCGRCSDTEASSRARAAGFLGDLERRGRAAARLRRASSIPTSRRSFLERRGARRRGHADAAAGRRAVEHVGRVRRRGDPEGLPAGARRARTPTSRSSTRSPRPATSTPPKPVGTWQRDGRDLGVAREYLAGGADGWHLALTSLRDLYDRRCPPEECGGDFAPEARRLGEATAELHVALATAFGPTTRDADGVGRRPARRR